jgi:hypothetical protein
MKNAVVSAKDSMMLALGVYLPEMFAIARNWCHKVMAAGDAQRVWFDEMIDRLRLKWHREMHPEELIQLRDELDQMLQQIRSDRQLRPPLLRCPECGHVVEAAASHVSVRAMILSVIRFEIDDTDTTRSVEKQWKAYQKANRLDLNGKPDSPRTKLVSQAHSHTH